MNVAILYDGHADGWSDEDVRQVLEMTEHVSRALHSAGHETTRVPARPGLAWVQACAGADAVFNLCEGLGGISQYEPFIVGALELLGIPFTGAGARTIALCHDKHVVNAVLAASGLPVPRWDRVADGRVRDRFPLPALVKPAAEDASVGIEHGSVVTTREALEERVAAQRAEYDGLLVQQYIDGREFAVGFLGGVTLPISEIDFSRMPANAWPIVTFDAKWVAGSPDDIGTQPVCPASIPSALAEELQAIARAAWQAVGGQGYGRVDLRVDRRGAPWVIEVNPNPDISQDAGLARMAHAAGMTYCELVLSILDDACRAAEEPGPVDAAVAPDRAGTGVA